MENPTPTKGRASCVRFADATHEAVTTANLRLQIIATRYAVAPKLVAQVALLTWRAQS
jgi:hypothetical protein